jgi:hypothetical protein
MKVVLGIGLRHMCTYQLRMKRYPKLKGNKGLRCSKLHIIFFLIIVLGAIVPAIRSLFGHLFASGLFFRGPNSPVNPLVISTQVSDHGNKHTEDHPPRQ